LKAFFPLFNLVVDRWEQLFPEIEDENLAAVWTRFKSKEPISREEFQMIFKIIGPYMKFEDLDLDTLKLLCNYMRIPTFFGFHPIILTRRLKKLMKFLEKDDKMIASEGPYTGIIRMFEGELRNAANERGLKVIGSSSVELRRDLFFWVQMSLSKEYVPAALLYFAAFRVHGKILPHETAVASEAVVPQFYKRSTSSSNTTQ
jgi:hypothetical protein